MHSIRTELCNGEKTLPLFGLRRCLYSSSMEHPLTILAAPNTFKESLTALEACAAMQRGIHKVQPDAVVRMVPVADGGDGTIQALVDATQGEIFQTEVHDPLGRPAQAKIGKLGGCETFVVEMALASGLWMLTDEERNPLNTSTYGTGECIRAVLDRGAKKILIGIGGSATNEGGAGMARALGYRLLDEAGQELDGTGASLEKLDRIDASNADPRLASCEITVMCDVDNPLTGPKGASAVYGPQKGASPEMVKELDGWLERFAQIVKRDLGTDILTLPGSGAAGGLGGGLVAFTGAHLAPGFQTVAQTVGFYEALEGADLVLTGEGRLDGSTAHGKVPAGVAQAAAEKNIPVIALAGCLADGWQVLYKQGVTAAMAITTGPMPLDRAMLEADALLSDATEQAFRLFLAGRAAKGQPIGHRK